MLIPNVRDAFHLSDAEILAIVALAGAAALLGTVPVAWLADRTVRVRIALIGGAVAAVFSVALGFAPTAVVMAITLCGVQLGQAVIFPTHNSLIADYYPVESRTRVYSIHRAGLSLGIVSGVLIGAGLTAAFGSWRVPFVVFAVPIVAVVLVGLRLREPPRGRFEEAALPGPGPGVRPGRGGGGSRGGRTRTAAVVTVGRPRPPSSPRRPSARHGGWCGRSGCCAGSSSPCRSWPPPSPASPRWPRSSTRRPSTSMWSSGPFWWHRSRCSS